MNQMTPLVGIFGGEVLQFQALNIVRVGWHLCCADNGWRQGKAQDSGE
jgi:hypothetical protein